MTSFQIRIPIIEFVDAGFVALMLWAGLVWLRRTRARPALLGLALVGALHLMARRLNLELAAWLLQGFFVVSVVVFVFVFQEDLRRLFEQLATWGRRRGPALPPGTVESLVLAVARLAETRTGALIVLAGREHLDRHLDAGIELDAELSEPLLLSLFDRHSPGHDGAIVVSGDRVARFAVHLPLSSDREQLEGYGTRHAAALGLAERTDALCIVVSEERGAISAAQEGRLSRLPDTQALAGVIREFLARSSPPEEARTRVRGALARWREAVAAVALAAALWALFVPGSAVVEMQRSAPVHIENLPPGYALEEVEPQSVEVTLSGRRRDLYFVDPGALSVRIDALLVQLGRRTFQVSPSEVEHPENLRVVEIEPTRVRVYVRRESDEQLEASEGS